MAEKYKTFNIALDMRITRSGGRTPRLFTGDTGNKFVITLTDDGVAYDLSTARVAVIIVKNAGGSAMQTSWAVDGGVAISGASNNIVTVTLKSTSYGVGTNTCQLQILSGTLYDTVVTSTYFNFEGESPAVNDNTIVSSDEYTVLTDLIADVQQVHDNYASDVQSDWDETNNTLGTFIVNKPVIGTDIQQATQGLTEETSILTTDIAPGYRPTGTSHHFKATVAAWITAIRTALFGASDGLLKADGSGTISAAEENTDYAAATHASRHASGAADAVSLTSIATAGVDYTSPTTISMINGGGVFTGGAVTAQGTPDQTVAVSAGSIITPEGKRYAFDAVSALAATAADGSNPRIDIVYVTSAGVVTYLAGTAASSPAQPSTPANGTILAAVARATGDNTIATSDITDQRDFITTANDFEDVVSVTEGSNTFACDFAKKHTKNFSFSVGNTNGKTVTFSNVPYGTCDSIISIKATATAAFTWTLDGRTLVWPAGAPTLTSGYTYDILFSYSVLLGKWVGRAQIGVAN